MEHMEYMEYPICFSVIFRAPRDLSNTGRARKPSITSPGRGRIIGSASLSMAVLGLKFVEVLDRFRQKI